jgi:hypothetical protein
VSVNEPNVMLNEPRQQQQQPSQDPLLIKSFNNLLQLLSCGLDLNQVGVVVVVVMVEI